jgi:hypothetical protein
MAQAMSKITDPMRRAALAQKVFGDSSLAPLLAQGAKGIAELRQRYLELAGSQAPATAASEEAKSAMVDLGAATDGVKAALVTGLGPALTVIAKQLSAWLVGHRKEIAEWADKVGKWLPGAINGFVDGLVDTYERVKKFFSDAWDFIAPIIDKIKKAVDSVGSSIDIVKSVAGGSLVGIGNAVADRAKAALPPPSTPAQVAIQAMQRVVKPNTPFDVAMQAASAIPSPADADARVLAPRLNDDVMDRIVGGLRAQQQQSAVPAPPPPMPQAAAVTVRFENAPRGMRATVDPKSTADVDLSTGFQMSFTP